MQFTSGTAATLNLWRLATQPDRSYGRRQADLKRMERRSSRGWWAIAMRATVMFPAR